MAATGTLFALFLCTCAAAIAAIAAVIAAAITAVIAAATDFVHNLSSVVNDCNNDNNQNGNNKSIDESHPRRSFFILRREQALESFAHRIVPCNGDRKSKRSCRERSEAD